MQLVHWIDQIVRLCRPEAVHLCDGSDTEAEQLAQLMISKGQLVRLNPALRPNSFWCRSHPDDVARVEDRTFICSATPEAAGPSNNWADPAQMRSKIESLFQGSMRGRTAYVIPFLMGPPGCRHSLLGVEITDSPYVVLNMRIMNRIGAQALQAIQHGASFIPCLHSVGMPLTLGEQDSYWPCNPQEIVIAHFPEERRIFSYGSGYGGNALLSKKCVALRIASVIARDEGWLAEHMLIASVIDPEGSRKTFTAAFPSACGKTVLSMLDTRSSGWRVECIGDDIAWIWPEGERLRAVNPETGIFGVAPGTSVETSPHIMETISRNSIFTNTALTADGDVWWEGMTAQPPEGVTSWLGRPWRAESGEKAAHPNSRFTAPLSQSPVLDPRWQDPEGVPLDAILFGGRRSSTVPLVAQATNWHQGVFMGASLCSETTAAATGAVGMLRHDPFAMWPFCGYNIATYFQHWESFANLRDAPEIFSVNWFRRDAEGKFLWPGFSANLEVLKWIHARCGPQPPTAHLSKMGWLPDRCAGFPPDLVTVSDQEAQHEIHSAQHYLRSLGSNIPTS
jgi:phosphoenolpyruvate carboxykinase (GTP)